MFQFDASVGGRELPLNFDSVAVTFCFPSAHFCGDRLLVRNAAVETLSPQYAEFDFSHIEPATVFRCVMKPKAMVEAMSFRCRKGFIEGSSIMRVEIVEYDNDLLCMWIVYISSLVEN